MDILSVVLEVLAVWLELSKFLCILEQFSGTFLDNSQRSKTGSFLVTIVGNFQKGVKKVQSFHRQVDTFSCPSGTGNKCLLLELSAAWNTNYSGMVDFSFQGNGWVAMSSHLSDLTKQVIHYRLNKNLDIAESSWDIVV